MSRQHDPQTDADTEINLLGRFRGSQSDTQEQEWIRTACLETARIIAASTPQCREQSVAFTKLEEAMFWACAGIERRQ